MNLNQAFAGQATLILVPSVAALIVAGIAHADFNSRWAPRVLRIGLLGCALSLLMFSAAIWAAVR